jgi:hypothetical protein
LACDHYLAEQDTPQNSGTTAKHAALAVVASAILNLDEVLTK